jgi:tetratricopeptide (TPR) repeat protein
MSLLLEALKKAEKAKEDAQRRAQEGDGAPELRLADEAPEPARHVVTRDELPPITSPLEIQSEDLRAEPAPPKPSGLSLQRPASPPPAARSASAGADSQAAQRATARKPFEAKVREPNPRLPFFIAMGALGAFAVGVVVYFWIQLQPPASLYNANPPPPANENTVNVAANAPAPTPTAASTPVGGIQGLPPAPGATRAPAPAPTATPGAKPAPAATRPAAEPRRAAPRVQSRPAPIAQAPRQSARSEPAVDTTRPAPRIHPQVAAGYAAYQAGDMERARAEYGRVLAEEPANRDALLGMAAIETRAQRVDVAENLYRRLLLADPRDPHATAGLIALRGSRPGAVAAESRLKGLLANGAGEGVLQFALGNQFAQQGRWAEAQQAYLKALADDPENPDYAYNLAVSHEQLRQPELALLQYRQALIQALKRTASFDPAAAQARVQALSR